MSGGADRAVAESLARTVLWPSRVAIAVLAAAFSVGLVLPERLRYLPLIASVALVGLPHGAVDHLAIPRARDEETSPRWLARVGLLYLLVGGAYAGLWFVAPGLSALLFILMTLAHWGQGDLWPLLSVTGADHLRSGVHRLGTLLVRGGPPMLVPLWFFPGRYRAVVEAIVGRFGVSGAAVDPVFDPEVRAAVVGGLAALSVLVLLVGVVGTDDRAAWTIDAGETALLWWFFAVVPPVFAIGVYFTVWHSLRHVGRLVATDPEGRGALARDRPLAAFGRFAREATPLTLLSLVGLVGLYVAVPDPPTDVGEFVGLYLVFIAVLTLPHVVVVAVMDAEQGVWSAESPSSSPR
jgi:Brp/Blh family beta-carotene 15,15'-monooxygenase